MFLLCKQLFDLPRCFGTLAYQSSLNFLALYMKSRTALTAEVLFLRKQLAYYQERKAVPRRSDNENSCISTSPTTRRVLDLQQLREAINATTFSPQDSIGR